MNFQIPLLSIALALSTPLLPGSVGAQTCATTSAPVFVRDLAPMELEYQGTFATSERTMAVSSGVTVAHHAAGGWAVAEHAVLPRGSALDSARLESRSLVPRERTIQQGALQIVLAFTDAQATGTITTAGQSRAIAVPLCGSLVGDGAGSFLVIGLLPLTADYHISLSHLDVQKAEETMRQLAVVGSERATVPAGSFETWKVQLTENGSANTTTIWVDKTSLLPVRFSAIQGPVTITMELAKVAHASVP